MAITAADITKAGWYDSDAGVIYVHGLNIVIEASRTSGVSPCSVIFTCRNTTIPGYDEHEVIGTGGTKRVGYYFDFDDPTSGNFNTYHGTSKNISVGGYMAMHTFEVADGGGSVDFEVRVRAKTDTGAEGIGTITITVQAQDDYYTAGNTIAISNTLTPGSWHLNGEDRNPPSGYTEYATLAAAGNTADGNIFWPDIQGKRILLYRGDDFSAEGPIYIRSGNDNFHVSWFGDEDSGTTTGPVSTIWFQAPTDAEKNLGAAGFIATSDSASYVAGREVTVSGSDSNDSTWTVHSTGPGWIAVRYNKGAVIVDESPGASITLTEHNALPEIHLVKLGTKDAAATSNAVMDDAELLANATQFSNDGWCENGYFDGIRVAGFDNGISWKHMTFHRIDCDRHEEAASGINQGTIDAGEGTYSVKNPTKLDPASVPFVYGYYISDCVFIGSPLEIAGSATGTTTGTTVNKLVDSGAAFLSTVSVGMKVANTTAGGATTISAIDSNTVLSLNKDIMESGEAYTIGNDNPTKNIGSTGSIILWYGICGTTARAASEMNLRTQGWRDFIIHDVDLLGQHIGGSGNKGRAVIRGRGQNQVGDLTESSRYGDFMSDATDTQLYPHAQYQLTQYHFDSAANEGGSTSSGWDNAGTQETQNTSTMFDVLATHVTIDNTATNTLSNQWILETVKWACATSFTGLYGGGISDNANDDSFPILHNGPDNVVINGVKSTEANWLGPTYFDEFGTTDYVLPVPTAPR